MLQLIPAPLHRMLYRLAYALRKRWLRLTRASVYGCSIIARNSADEILLVRHSYGPPIWAFPGGGIGRLEDPLDAAKREFYEELGCPLEDVVFLGQQHEPYHGTQNYVSVFCALLQSQPVPDQREIVDAAFFALDDLPSNISQTVLMRLQIYPPAASALVPAQAGPAKAQRSGQ